ncbi:serine--tRNA ligase [Candidatus Shapirobacteria bacterium]|nr:serine--tRNA ligase [Candidatus Shapirobacteria bacterium]
MLDIKFIRENAEVVKKALEDRQKDPEMVGGVLAQDSKKRVLLQQVEELRARRNKITKDQIKEGRKIKEELRVLEEELKGIDAELMSAIANIPNIPASDVPVGKDDSENVEVKKWGEPPKFDFKPKDHVEIGEALDIIDIRRAGKVSGTRFGYFKGEGAILELALMWYVFKKLANKGFIANVPPVITKKEIEWGMGYSEHGGWDQMYLFEKDGVLFVSSSEHSVIPMHKDEVFNESQLPLRYVNFSSCFRREAGTYGKDTRGLFRVHQFNKVEMNVYTISDIEISDKECLYLLAMEEEIVRELGLAYRVMNCCTGDIPLPNRRMYDVECWYPGQNKYREIQSCSNCTDYQTRRLNIKVKTKNGEKFVHALNATAITDRAILAILENYQQEDGSVLIPKVLQKYTGFAKISPKG